MGIYVVNQVIKLMIKKGHKIEGSKVLVLGITFKENCPDIRNSRAIDVIKELQDFGCDVSVTNYWADAAEVKHEYDLELTNDINYDGYEAIVMAVSHDKYKVLTFENKDQVVYDIKSILNTSDGKL